MIIDQPDLALEVNGFTISPSIFTPNLHSGNLNAHERTPFCISFVAASQRRQSDGFNLRGAGWTRGHHA